MIEPVPNHKTIESTFEIEGLKITLIQKRIKNLSIGVYPPDGRIRVSAPLSYTQAHIVRSILPRMAWIKKHRSRIAGLSEQSKLDTPSGPVRYLLGQRYPFEIKEHTKKQSHLALENGILKLYVAQNLSESKRVLILGVKAKTWSIRQMKSKWGSCHIQDRKIIFNLELVKHTPACIEYVVAHELIHFIEPSHNARFKRFMTEAIPNWKALKLELQKIPMDH